MKRILITGENSYIGTHLEQHLARFPDAYAVQTLAMLRHTPDEYDFHGADAVVHVAAIVHQKETTQTIPLYNTVNCDLAFAVAKQAKKSGVSQFILFSTMSVYGMETGVITKDTAPKPVTHYGRSKLAAERAIALLGDDAFKVTILRPPMVFGEGAKGNYARLETLTKRLPFLPDFENRRTLVSVETLCEAIRGYLDEPRSGVFFPQEAEPVSTTALMEQIAAKQGRTPKKTKAFNPAIRLLRVFSHAGKKAFGDLVYQDLSELPLSAAFKEEGQP